MKGVLKITRELSVRSWRGSSCILVDLLCLEYA